MLNIMCCYWPVLLCQGPTVPFIHIILYSLIGTSRLNAADFPSNIYALFQRKLTKMWKKKKKKNLGSLCLDLHWIMWMFAYRAEARSNHKWPINTYVNARNDVLWGWWSHQSHSSNQRKNIRKSLLLTLEIFCSSVFDCCWVLLWVIM